MDDRKIGLRDLAVGLVGLVVSVPVLMLITLSTVTASSCSNADEIPICGPALHLFVGYGPLAAATAGFALAAVGGGWAVYRHRSPVRWLLAAYGLVGVVVLAACGLGLAAS